jgi:hypothetical protein
VRGIALKCVVLFQIGTVKNYGIIAEERNGRRTQVTFNFIQNAASFWLLTFDSGNPFS